MFNNKIFGFVLSISGFLLLVYSAVNYLFALHLNVPSGAIGIILVVFGTVIVKKSKSTPTEKSGD